MGSGLHTKGVYTAGVGLCPQDRPLRSRGCQGLTSAQSLQVFPSAMSFPQRVARAERGGRPIRAPGGGWPCADWHRAGSRGHTSSGRGTRGAEPPGAGQGARPLDAHAQTRAEGRFSLRLWRLEPVCGEQGCAGRVLGPPEDRQLGGRNQRSDEGPGVVSTMTGLSQRGSGTCGHWLPSPQGSVWPPPLDESGRRRPSETCCFSPRLREPGVLRSWP